MLDLKKGNVLVNVSGTSDGLVVCVCLFLDTVLAFKKKMKVAQFAEKDPEAMRETEAREREEKEMAEAMALDSRCEVVLPGAMPRRGTVVFTGKYLVN